jgi:hypothetical protein
MQSKSTKENPLAFFTDYFESRMDNVFIRYEEEKRHWENYVNSSSGEDILIDFRTLPFKEEDHHTFEEYVLLNTKSEVSKTKNLIEQGFEMRSYLDKEVKAYAKFLKTKLDLLSKLPKFKEYQFLHKIIDDLNEYISSFSNVLIRDSNIQNTLNDDLEKTMPFFQLKDGIKSSFLKKLYDIVIHLDLIDDIDTQEDIFVEVFMSPKPLNKIQFIKANLSIAFFFKEVEPFFEDLNPTTIEKSKIFLNKQGKKLTSTDLYTALSRNKDNKKIELLKIQDGINLLKKQYLK